MIYFKITDKTSAAWKRHRKYQVQRNEAFDQVRELIEYMGLETNQFKMHLGSVTSFIYEEGDHVPEYMKIRDNERLVPDARFKEGKKVRQRMRAISIPTQGDYMELMFGAQGEEITGKKMYTGVGLVVNSEQVLIKSRPGVFEDAKSKDSFGIPEGCEEITGTEYQELYDGMFEDKTKDVKRQKKEAKS